MALRQITDARGASRPAYNLRKRWRSPESQREVPEGIFTAICNTALGGEEINERRLPRSLRAMIVGLWGAAAVAAANFVHAPDRFGGPGVVVLVGAPALTLLAIVGMRFVVLRRTRRLLSRLECVNDEQIAAAMLAHGRCPSCAYSLDLTRPEPDGAVVCPECSGAWAPARAGRRPASDEATATSETSA